jgi:hypothetical protein
MGVANAQRMLNYIRIITEFISQPEYRDVIPIFSIINEALVKSIGKDSMSSLFVNNNYLTKYHLLVNFQLSAGARYDS